VGPCGGQWALLKEEREPVLDWALEVKRSPTETTKRKTTVDGRRLVINLNRKGFGKLIYRKLVWTEEAFTDDNVPDYRKGEKGGFL